MPRSRRFNIPARILACCLALAFAWPALAQADTARFEIKAEPLSAALKAFAQQAHMQLLYEYTVVQDLQGNPVIGVVEKHAALTRLLRNTGLEAVFTSDAAATIRPMRARIPNDAPKSPAKKDDGRGRAGTKSASKATGVATLDDGSAAGVDSANSAPHNSGHEEPPALQEIIVTAQKYAQRAFDVPISLQVINGDELQQHGITNLSDLQYDVPGLYMNSTGTQHSVYLRGVGNYLGNGAMVGQYIDDADITAGTYYSGTQGYGTGDNGLYDLNRVEVLKGPQGTLYGDGSMGGVIRYITNKPVLDQYQMSAHVAELFTEYGAPSQQIETMLNTPLIDGTLGMRVAGMFEHDGGWVDEPAANLKNVNGGNLTDVRAEALWQPTGSFRVNATQILHRNTSGLGAGEDANGNITPLFGTTFTPNSEDNSNLSNLTMTYEFAGARLLSSSTHLDGVDTIYNAYASETFNGSPPPTYWYLTPYFHVGNEGWSEELRLVHAERGSWQWSVGGFYKDYRESLSYPGEYFGAAGTPLSSAFPFPGNDARDSSRSWAGFADTSYKLFDRLTLGAGVRYFKDRETSWNARYLSSSSNQLSTQLGPPTFFAPETFNSTDPRFYAQYRVTSHVNSYISASKGFRSGGPNSTPAEPPYQPETLWSYDLGTKIRYPEEGVQADVDLFDMNYSNFVSDTYIPPVYELSNVGRARNQGVDADLTWRPVDQWTMSLNAEFLHTEFLTASAISGYAPGNRLPFAPKYSFTASVERSFRWKDKPGDVEVYYYEISRVQYRLAGIPLHQSDILHFLNGRADIHWNDNVTLGLFARNLLNDRGYESPLYFGSASMRPQPRTYGVEFHVNFEEQ